MLPEWANVLTQSVLGVAVVGLTVAVVRLFGAVQASQAELREVMEARVAEARGVTDKLREASSEWMSAIAEVVQLLTRYNNTVEALRSECAIRTDSAVRGIEATRVAVEGIHTELARGSKGGQSS